ncbi:hypothetical protein B6D60_00505 [candidate division KSB1 bacterium 4484_87]|nr:MAG: hypothetical protein B6D60_00505 [candidate division KSB1 bacterium 4484_87]
MKRITKIWVLVFFVMFNSQVDAIGIQFHGRASNSFYSYEDTTTHTRMYQLVRFSMNSPQLANATLNASFRTLTDFNQSLDSDMRFRAYQLNLEFKKLLNRFDIVIGRQFLHPGTVLGGLDGLFARARIVNHLSLSLYAGVESHFNRSFKIYKFDDSFTAGGVIDLKKIFSSNLQLLYLQKMNSEDIFWQIAGINFNTRLVPKTWVQLQTHYDLQNSRFHRIYFNARHHLLKNLYVNIGVKNQYPQVYANSFFTIFEIDPYWQYRLGGSYRLKGNYFVNCQYQLIQFDTETANRVFFTVSNLNGSVGLVYESGYAGDQIGVVLDYGYQITQNLLASLNVDYSRYRTEKVYEFENQIANAVRLSYRFKKYWSVDLEYQWLTNRFKESDSRVLNHIHFSW